MPQIEATPLTAHWGRRIRRARQDKHLSLNRLARLAEIDPGNLSRIEHGKQGASDEMRLRIAAGLGMKVDALFNYPDDVTQAEEKAS